MNGNAAKTVIKDFFHAYLVRRDMEKAASFLSESIQWVGTGADEIVKGKSAAAKALRQELLTDPAPYRVTFLELDASVYGEGADILARMLVSRPQADEAELSLEMRLSASCRMQGGAPVITSLHASFPASTQREGEYFPERGSDESSEQFGRRITQRSMDLLNRSIPGGMMGGYIEPGYPLYFINERLLEYLGYGSYEEYTQAIQGYVVNCMHPQDAPAVLRTVDEAMSKGLEYEVQYRMRRKDGGYLWVNDIGHRVYSDSGRAVCISTIRDIDNETRALREIQMKEELFRIAALQSNNIVFLYDLQKKEIRVTHEIAARFGIEEVQHDIPGGAVRRGIVPPDSVEEYMRLHGQMLAGEKFAKGVVRLRDQNGISTYELTFTAVDNGKEKPTRAVGVYHDISRQLLEKKRNREIRRQKQWYDKLVDSVLCGIVQYTADGNGLVTFKSANREARRIFGYTQQEFQAKKLWNLPDLIAPQDKERILCDFAKLCRVGDKQTYEYRLQQRDGTACWIVGSVEIVEDIDGETVYQSVFLDINNRKRAEIENRSLIKQVAASRELLRFSLENTAFYDFFYYPRDHVVINSERTCSFFSCKRRYENMPESFAAERVAPEFRGMFCRAYRQIEEGCKTATCEFETATPGRWSRVILSAVDAPSDGGSPSMVVGFAEDITREKNVELQNIHLQAIYDYTMEHDYVCLCIVDVKKQQYALHISGRTSLRDVPLTGGYETGCRFIADRFLCAQDRPVFLRDFSVQRLQGMLLHRQSPVQKVLCTARGRYIELRACRFEENPDMLLLSVRDIHEAITKEKHDRQKLQQALQTADAANRAKTEFLSRMSHEIRTPMNAIIGMTSLAMMTQPLSPDLCDKLGKIESSSRFLLSLINDILDMSRIESQKMTIEKKPFSLRAVIQDIENMMHPQMREKGLGFSVQLPRHDGWTGDAAHIKQVLVNLFSNAVKFTPQGGSIRLEALGQPDAKGLRMCVKDTGIGIAREDQERIFRSFEQAGGDSANQMGTGLGLAISKSLVELMGGELHVESAPGAGADFWFTLPLDPISSVPVQEPLPRPQGDGLLSGKRILLAEDNDINAEIAASLLELKGIETQRACDGRQAVEMFCAHGEGYYALVLMDLQMPVLDGLAAAREIRALPRPDAGEIPILAMTANTFQEDVQAAFQSGMDGFLPKPVEVGKLYEALHQAVAGKRQPRKGGEGEKEARRNL